MLKPKLNQVPLIYNLDKVRLYKDYLLIAEFWVGQYSPQWYFENDERTKPLLENYIEAMSICIEGCLSDIAVLEIYLK